MSWVRAVMRRLDPWAALLLGGLLAMGVVILLATPGPWQRVVGKQSPVRLEAPAPDDVAVFVMGGRGGACSGVLWLHLDAERNALAAVVVAPRVSGFSPTDGYAPLAAIAESAGPSAAAAALGGALGVSMDAWVALDRKASDLAIQAMFPANEPRAARTRYREARSAWRGLGGDTTAWATQYASLRVALPQVPFDELGVVAFSNYVLGFGFVRSDLSLQGATSLAEALRDVDPGRVEVRAAPVVVERSRGGEVWHADASRVEPLRQSLAMGMRPPETGKLVTTRVRAARVLVVAPLARARAARYADEVRRRLARLRRRRDRRDAGGGSGRPAGVPRRPRTRPPAGARRPGLAGRLRRCSRRGGHPVVRDAAKPPAGGGRLRAAARGRRRLGSERGARGRRRGRPPARLLAAARAAQRRRAPATGAALSWLRRGTTSRRSSARAGRARSLRISAPRASTSRSSPPGTLVSASLPPRMPRLRRCSPACGFGASPALVFRRRMAAGSRP